MTLSLGKVINTSYRKFINKYTIRLDKLPYRFLDHDGKLQLDNRDELPCYDFVYEAIASAFRHYPNASLEIHNSYFYA